MTASDALDRARSALRADEANEPCSVPTDGDGLDARCVERLAPVIDDLERSLRCGPSLAAANNLAVALLRQGRVLRALALFEEILTGARGSLTEAQRAAIVQQIERTRADLAMLEIESWMDGAHHDAEIRVDGTARGATTEEEAVLRVMVDPGQHRLDAEALNLASEPLDATLRRGEVRGVRLSLSPVACETEGCGAVPPRQNQDGLWVGLGIGGGVVLIAGAIVLGVVLAQPDLPGPMVMVPPH